LADNEKKYTSALSLAAQEKAAEVKLAASKQILASVSERIASEEKAHDERVAKVITTPSDFLYNGTHVICL
jgi:hypothetical protein